MRSLKCALLNNHVVTTYSKRIVFLKLLFGHRKKSCSCRKTHEWQKILKRIIYTSTKKKKETGQVAVMEHTFENMRSGLNHTNRDDKEKFCRNFYLEQTRLR
jgi:hypothetical protein